MTPVKARSIGSRYGILSGIIGLAIAQAVICGAMFLFSNYDSAFRNFFWFLFIDSRMSVFLAVAIFLTCAYFAGRIAAMRILINNNNHFVWGLLAGIITITATALLCNWMGLFRTDNAVTDETFMERNIIQPFHWIFLFGTMPAAVVGIWMGYKIKQAGNRHNKAASL